MAQAHTTRGRHDYRRPEDAGHPTDPELEGVLNFRDVAVLVNEHSKVYVTCRRTLGLNTVADPFSWQVSETWSPLPQCPPGRCDSLRQTAHNLDIQHQDRHRPPLSHGANPVSRSSTQTHQAIHHLRVSGRRRQCINRPPPFPRPLQTEQSGPHGEPEP